MHKIMLLFAAGFLVCLGLIIGADPAIHAPQQPDAPAATASPAPTASPTPLPVLPTPGQSTPLQKTALPFTPDDPEYYESLFMAVEQQDPPNHELQTYLPQQVRVEGNHLTFTAQKKEDDYVSGRLESIFSFQYGTIRFRINTMQGEGLFPAVWMLPANGHPAPEVDIYELIGSEPDTFYGVIHYLTNANRTRNRLFFNHVFPSDAIPESYVLTFEWTPDALNWYLEDTLIHSITEQVPQMPMYLIFNLAVGGDWAGDLAPDALPAQLHIEMLDFAPQEIYTR